MEKQRRKANGIESKTPQKQKEEFMRLCEEANAMAAKLMHDLDAGQISAEQASVRNRELFQRLKQVEEMFVNFTTSNGRL